MNFNTWLENNETIESFPESTVTHLVYHGTNNSPFDQFLYQKSKRFILFSSFDVESKGFFFSESPHDALEFGKNIVACYIDLKNPLLDPRRDKNLSRGRLSYKKEIDIQKILSPMIEKNDRGHYVDIGISRYYIQDSRRRFGREWIYDTISSDGLAWDALDNPKVVQKMIQFGYDGTFVSDPDTSLGRSIFVPKSDQIRIVKWFDRKQDSWKEKDDYYISKKDGYDHLQSPDNVK